MNLDYKPTPKPTPPSFRPAIALVGYRATGKSTVGRRLADRLGWPFADTDSTVESNLGLSIPEIFSRLGEPAFRQAETRALAALTARSPLVLATGGGAVLDLANRQALRRFGLVVWLQAPPEVLVRRLESDPSDTRPALTSAGPRDEIATVLAAREPLYREVCHLALDTTQLDPVQVAHTIQQYYLNGLPSSQAAIDPSGAVDRP